MAHFLCHLGCSHFGALLLDFYFTENKILGGETLQDGDYEPTFEFVIQPVTSEKATINADMNFSFEITSSAY